jgi:hypothetical protein
MASHRDDTSRSDKSSRSRDMRRDTDMRGSMGTPASGRERDQNSGEQIRGSSSESQRPPRQPGRMPLPD